ncbi:MAG: FHA domain-containing protein [Thermogutta sp.]
MSTKVESLSLPSESALGTRNSSVFRVCGSSQEGREVRLHSARISIGSAEGCTLRIRARGVQPVHCLVVYGRKRTVVRRTHPATLLNDRPFSDAELRHGDRLRVGPVVLEYRDDGDESVSSPVFIPADNPCTTASPPEPGKSVEDRLADEKALRDREDSVARRERELACLAESLRRREDELAIWEGRLNEAEKRLEERERQHREEGEDHRSREQEWTARWTSLEEREREAAAREQELRQWEARIADREERWRQDEEELRRRVCEIAARERELSAWEESLRQREPMMAAPAETASDAIASASAAEDGTAQSGYRDSFAPLPPTLSGGRRSGGDGAAEGATAGAILPEVSTGTENNETSLISAKWLPLREQDTEEQEPDSAKLATQMVEAGTESRSDSRTGGDSRQADDSDTGDIQSYMQSLLERMKGRDETMETARKTRGAASAATDTCGFSPAEDAKSKWSGKETHRERGPVSPRERPRAAEKSVDFAAMRELAVLASQGAIDRYAKAKLRKAMRGKLAVLATALSCGLLLTALAWAGRLPEFGIYGIVAAGVTILVYVLQYAILSGRLVVNSRGQLQLAQRRISREMFKLQTGEKAPLGITTEAEAAAKPQARGPAYPVE